MGISESADEGPSFHHSKSALQNIITIRDRVHIAAAPEEVFSVLDQPERQTEFTPNLTASTLVERLENGGARVRYTYRLLGLAWSGEVRATDYTPPERIVWSLTGDLHGTIRWYLEPAGDGTQFTYAATYAVPGPSFLRPVLSPLVRRSTERELGRLLDRLKRQIESHR